VEHIGFNMRFVFLLCILFLIVFSSTAQSNYRINAKFTVKEKKTDGTTQLIMGSVFYDKNYKKLVYDISFPEKETLVIMDSVIYKIRNNKVAEKKYYPSLNEFTVFHLCLNGNLAHFGLDNSPYQLSGVEKQDSMVMSTWLPPKELINQLGKAIISQKEKNLYGMVFYNPSEEIISKHFFKNYQNSRGVEFPLEMIQITYHDKKELYKVTTFKDVVINEMKNENFYNYKLPD
jgi:hypothetical protein